MIRSEFDEEEKRRREAPMGDISPSTVSAGALDDDSSDDDSDDDSGMGGALDRAHETGGKDTFGVVAALGKDDGRPSPLNELPPSRGFGSSQPKPETTSTQPLPRLPEQTNPSSALASALANMSRFSAQRYTPRPELSDEAIAKARADRRQQIQHNDMSRAIQSWLLRKPFEPTPPEDTVSELLQQRQGEQSDFEKTQAQQISASSALARALRGEKPSVQESQSLVDWRKAQADRLKGLEARDQAATSAAQDKAARDKATFDEAATSTEAKRAAISADPRLSKLGVTAAMVQKMDRHDLDRLESQLGPLPKEKPKGGGTGAPPKAIKTVDDISDPGDRAKVQAVIDGRMGPEQVGRKDIGRIMGLVTQIAPTFDASRFERWKSVAGEMSKSPTVAAFNTAMGHIGLAEKNIPKNFDSQALNRAYQKIITAGGSAELTPFETEVRGIADEYAKMMGIGTESGRAEIIHMLSEAQSPEQIPARLATIKKMMGEKMGSLQAQVNAAAPKGVTMDLMTPEAKAAMGGGGDTVTVIDTKTGNKKTLSRESAAKYLQGDPGRFKEAPGG